MSNTEAPIVALYYTIESGEPLKLALAQREANAAFHKEAKAFAEEFECEHFLTMGHAFDRMGAWLSGLIFKGKRLPDGWKRPKHSPNMEDGQIAGLPKVNTKAGQALSSRMHAIKCPAINEFFELFGRDNQNMLIEGNRIRSANAGTIGDQWVAIVPIRLDGDLPPVPEGATRIEEWEFKKLQHEAEASKS